MPRLSAQTLPWQDILLVAGFALAVRLLFLGLTHDTYDYDEFVALLLGRDWAHGAVPYRDFMFFHPPGILVLTRLLAPLFNLWWPSARILMAIIDTATAVLVALLGRELWGRRAGFAAGAVYAVSPVALISAVRVGEDPLITFLGVLGLFLLRRRSARWSIAAGMCLGLAVWIKYPAAYFLPIYVLAAPRRALVALLSAAATLAAVLIPFNADWHSFYQQTVTFQRTRWVMANDIRLQTTLLYWLAANTLAAIALLWWLGSRILPSKDKRSVGNAAPVPVLPGTHVPSSTRGANHVDDEGRQGREPQSLRNTAVSSRGPGGLPLWLVAGFLLGVFFGFNSQVYYHYFVVVVPFAALLGGWLLVRLSRSLNRLLLALGLILAIAWGFLLQNGGPAPLYVTAAHLSDIQPTINLLRHQIPPGKVLADRFEYAYLADRPAVDQYFWNVGVLIGPGYLERRLGGVSAVVLSYGASSSYPPRFLTYLDRHLRHVRTPANTVWLPRGYARR